MSTSTAIRHMFGMAQVLTAVMSAHERVAELQAELRRLRRQARTWRPGRATLLQPTLAVKLTKVVIYSLCQDAMSASVWGQS